LPPAKPSRRAAEASARLQRTALHEAAHLIVAHLVGHQVTGVDIAPGLVEKRRHGIAGSMTHRRAGADPLAGVVIAVAGLMWDREVDGPNGERADLAAAGDVSEARATAAWLDPFNPDRIITQAMAIARQLIERNWAAVERLADRIVGPKRLSGAHLVLELDAALEGIDAGELLIARRRIADSSGREAWRAATERWHGSAAQLTREVYDQTWAAARERQVAEIIARRSAEASG
jgi:hypothetical protein